MKSAPRCRRKRAWSAANLSRNLAPNATAGTALSWEDVKALRHSRVAAWLNLTPAREHGKYACPSCESSDALDCDDAKRFVKCYSCGTAFSNIDLTMAVLGLDAVNAVKALADRFGVLALDAPGLYPIGRREPTPPLRLIPPDPTPEVCEVFAAVLEILTYSAGARAFFTRRGIPFHETAETFGLRGIDSRAEWADLYRALRDRFEEQRVLDALRPMKPGTDERRKLPWGGNAPALVIPYTFRGEVNALRFRHLTTTDKKQRYRDLGGRKPTMPFNADAMLGCEGRRLIAVEGEINAFCAYGSADVRVIGLPGAATPWLPTWTPLVRGVSQFVAAYDEDGAGMQARRALAGALRDELGAEWVASRGAFLTLPVGQNFNDLLVSGGLDDLLR